MSNLCQPPIHLPREAVIKERIQESPTLFTLRMAFTDGPCNEPFKFLPGQFNMLSLHGVGEIPISIVSDPEDEHIFDHTIRRIGRVTGGMEQLKPGDRLGVRGPFGRGWPLEQTKGRDVLIITGGLGCAPVVSVINYLMRRRDEFGRIAILQGVKHADDMIWRERYDTWAKQPDTQVLLAADMPSKGWPWHTGPVIDLLSNVSYDRNNAIAMLCGPEPMLIATIALLREQGLPDDEIWLSMERNMHCGIAQCGHCQIGPLFVCRDGPVFCYSEIAGFLGKRGF